MNKHIELQDLTDTELLATDGGEGGIVDNFVRNCQEVAEAMAGLLNGLAGINGCQY